jgi:hypothetical protein
VKKIESRDGLCDKCRKQRIRDEERMNIAAPGRDVNKSMLVMTKLVNCLRDLKVPRNNQQAVFQNVLPSTGLSPKAQTTMLEQWLGPDELEMPSPYRVHAGSSNGSNSDVRVVEGEDVHGE